MSRDVRPKVAIILLTWNQCQLTLECLASLEEMVYPRARLQVIVVDNGSLDDTAAQIEAAYPHVTLLVNEENLGFAEGNNVGLRLALQGDCDYVMLLNNDTAVAPDMLDKLIDVAESSAEIGIVSPKIYYFDEPTRIWCAGAAIDWHTGVTRRLQAEEYDKTDHTPAELAPREVDFVSGCAICLKREVVDAMGLLDPRYFIYYEETDWCVRAAKLGYKNVYVPGAVMWHKVSSAMKTDSPITAYYMSRNVLLFLRKSLPASQSALPIGRQLAQQMRTIAALSVKPGYRGRSKERDARIAAIADFRSGNFGKKTLST